MVKKIVVVQVYLDIHYLYYLYFMLLLMYELQGANVLHNVA